MTQQEILMKVNALAEREFDVNECFQQVLTRNRSIYWSWGVSKNASVKDRCILLKVNGHHHKGWVGITLGWMDTFDEQIALQINKHTEDTQWMSSVVIVMKRDFGTNAEAEP